MKQLIFVVTVLDDNVTRANESAAAEVSELLQSPPFSFQVVSSVMSVHDVFDSTAGGRQAELFESGKE